MLEAMGIPVEGETLAEIAAVPGTSGGFRPFPWVGRAGAAAEETPGIVRWAQKIGKVGSKGGRFATAAGGPIGTALAVAFALWEASRLLGRPGRLRAERSAMGDFLLGRGFEEEVAFRGMERERDLMESLAAGTERAQLRAQGALPPELQFLKEGDLASIKAASTTVRQTMADVMADVGLS